MRSRLRFPAAASLLLATGLLAGLLGLAGCSAPKSDIPQPVGGVLDLRSRDFSRGQSYPLTGSWDFLPGSVDIPLAAFMESHPTQRQVPDLWKGDDAGGQRGHGSGTYHLTVLLPPGTPPLALHYLSASTAFRIEVDGKSVVQVGVPSSDPAEARAAYKPGFARLQRAGERIEIMVRVSNYVYRSGGLWYPVFIGSAESIESTHLTEVAMAIAQSMALAIMSFILLLLFSLRPQERAFLFGGLLALLLALRLLVTGEYIITGIWPGIPFDLMIRMEYLTVFLAFPAAIRFFCSLFPTLMDKRLERACILPPLVFVLLTLSLPLDALTRSLFVFYCFAFMNIIVLTYTMFVNTVLKSDPEGIALFIGALILAASVVNDVFYSSFVWWTGNLAPWGFSVFVGFLLVIMVRRMTTAFAEAEELLVQKELLIREIHHRVKNSLQVVSSLISLQSNRIADPKMKEVFAALRQRILSMSLVHEKLYGKGNSGRLDLGNYLEDIVKLLVSKDSLESANVKLSVRAQSVQVDADSCFDAGLIVTELVSNAMKHGILPRGGGELRVSMEEAGDMVSILVEDDGPGFPEGFAPGSTSSLGYKLVSSMAKSNGGRLEILEGPGGRVRAVLRKVRE